MAVNLTRKTVVEAVTETTSGYVPIGNSLIDFSNWTPGTMPPSGYTSYGSDLNGTNAIVRAEGPFGNVRAIWSGTDTDGNPSSTDGGLLSNYFSIDPAKLYRFSVWTKRVILGSGSYYFGLGTSYDDSDGLVGIYTNAYSTAWQEDTANTGFRPGTTDPRFPSMNYYLDHNGGWQASGHVKDVDKWYLVVSHIHPHDSTDYGDHSDTGWYVAGSTSKVFSATGWADQWTPNSDPGVANWSDARFHPDIALTRIRTFVAYSSTIGTNQEYAMPRVDLIDGTEPSISDLVNNTDTNQNTPLASSPIAIYGDGASVWQADTTMIDMPALTGSLSPQKQLAGRSLANVSLQTCLQQDTSAPPTNANTTPDIDTLLIACGMTRLIVNAAPTGKRVSYVPTDTMNDDGSDVCSATVRSYQNGISTTSTGTYLNAEFNFTAGQAATVQFTGQGLYNDPVSSVFPTASAAADTRKLVQSEQLSIRASNDTSPYANIIPVCRSLTWNTGNTIIERPDVNSNDGLKLLRIVSRAPTLNLVIEADTIYPSSFPAGGSTATTGPFFSELKENAHHEIRFTHQTVSSQVNAYFQFLDCQLTSVNLSDDGGVRVYNLSYSLQMAADYAYPYYFAFYNYGA